MRERNAKYLVLIISKLHCFSWCFRHNDDVTSLMVVQQAYLVWWFFDALRRIRKKRGFTLVLFLVNKLESLTNTNGNEQQNCVGWQIYGKPRQIFIFFFWIDGGKFSIHDQYGRTFDVSIIRRIISDNVISYLTDNRKQLNEY